MKESLRGKEKKSRKTTKEVTLRVNRSWRGRRKALREFLNGPLDLTSTWSLSGQHVGQRGSGRVSEPGEHFPELSLHRLLQLGQQIPVSNTFRGGLPLTTLGPTHLSGGD